MQNWIVEFVQQLGPVGIGILMLLENVFPPLPSEIIMPLAGYLSSSGQLDFWMAVVAGSIGSLLGASFWYVLGRRLSYERLCDRVERHGSWVAMTPSDVDRAVEWFHGHGRFSVLLGRLMPVVRTLISVPAGFSRMPATLFLVLSGVGTAAWTLGLAYAGLLLGAQFEQIDRYIGPVSWFVIAGAVVVYIRRVLQIRRGSRE